MNLKNNYELDLNNLSSFFSYSNKKILFKDSKIELGGSNLNADLEFDFSKITEMSSQEISDSLLFDFNFKNSEIINNES